MPVMMQRRVQQRRPVRLTPMQIRALRKRRGMGQAPSVNPIPTCANLDVAQSVPQMVLLGGGGLAMVVGIIGAIVSDEYKEDFAIAAGVGLAASFVGGLWAASSLQTLYQQCSGPGLAALGPASVNPNQSTPAGAVVMATPPAAAAVPTAVPST
jgi:hypothetical protein